MHIWRTQIFLFQSGWKLLACWGGEEARSLFKDIGRRHFNSNTGPRSHEYLVQRIAVAVQRGNAAVVLGTISSGDNNNNTFYLFVFLFFYFFLFWKNTNEIVIHT